MHIDIKVDLKLVYVKAVIMSLFNILVIFFVVICSVSALTDVDSTCMITNLSQVESVVKNCTNIVVKIPRVPGGEVLELDLKDGSHVVFRGTTIFEYKQWEGPMVLIKGNGITVVGEEGSKFDGQGALYWDGLGQNGGIKPKLFRLISTGGSVFKNINLLNCPIWCASIQHSDSVTVTGWTIDVSSAPTSGPHEAKNTDGFGVSHSTNIVIENSVIKNQDDCVVVNRGSNMIFSNLNCSGGHGLSFSVTDGPVSNVTFSECIVSNSRNGIHVKVHAKSKSGFINDVTYKNIKLSGIRYYGINIQEDYGDDGHPATTTPITNLTLSDVTGTVNGSDAVPVYIMCGSGACLNWTWSGISITGGTQNSTCNYLPSGYSC